MTEKSAPPHIEIATFAAGCFWCVEAMFKRIKGVTHVESGYAGGTEKSPSYERVCSGETGAAEVIHIEYDASTVKFETLLEVFFKVHDPTSLNRQGNDIGTQYRSAVFFHNDQQKALTLSAIEALEKAKVYDKEIVTTLEPFANYTRAEDYHQNYYEERGGENSYCSLVVTPKIEKFKEAFKHLLV